MPSVGGRVHTMRLLRLTKSMWGQGDTRGQENHRLSQDQGDPHHPGVQRHRHRLGGVEALGRCQQE